MRPRVSTRAVGVLLCCERSLLFLLLLLPVSSGQPGHGPGPGPGRGPGQGPETPDWRTTLKTIRNGIHKIDTYLNAALDLFGGYDGLCRYKCADGYIPAPRPGYRPPPPNGCGSPLFGFHFDIGIPSMTKCCNQHDRCYDTCGREKQDCDETFQDCLDAICQNVQKTLGLAKSVQACESAVTLLFDAVMHLGCKPYMDSQRETCICLYEIKKEL